MQFSWNFESREEDVWKCTWSQFCFTLSSKLNLFSLSIADYVFFFMIKISIIWIENNYTVNTIERRWSYLLHKASQTAINDSWETISSRNRLDKWYEIDNCIVDTLHKMHTAMKSMPKECNLEKSSMSDFCNIRVAKSIVRNFRSSELINKDIRDKNEK